MDRGSLLSVHLFIFVMCGDWIEVAHSVQRAPGGDVGVVLMGHDEAWVCMADPGATLGS